ncbi:MAG: PspC domain-containing protein [Candidatus Omnitrophota bacterium]
MAGVCSGLANYFNIDPAIVRIVFLLTAIFWGVSIILYFVCWICIPKDIKNKNENNKKH